MRRVPAACVVALLVVSPCFGQTVNLSNVPLWDGETEDGSGTRLNRFGGNPVEHLATVARTTNAAEVRSGAGALKVTTSGTIGAGDFAFVATALAGFGPSTAYLDTRDLTPFAQLTFWIRNDTGEPFTVALELKDYRDDNNHRARRLYTVGATSSWMSLAASLDLSSGWTVSGTPDLTRIKLITLVIEANQGSAVSGPLLIDDMYLMEKGGALDVDTAPADSLVARLAERQFRALWGTRDRTTGMMPRNSYFADHVATNTLAGVVQLLPTAVDRGWLTQASADTFVAQAVATLTGIPFAYVPPRYMDRVTLASIGPPREESSVDAAMLYLAMYRYKSRSSIAASLRSAIESLLSRFNFAAFSSAGGWRLAYLSDSGAFTSGTYDGYSGEPWIISMAAHLSASHHVSITTHYHSAVNRVRTQLVAGGRAHVVHSFSNFRAPFLQWLYPLFIDLEDRGADTYPDVSLATNPFDNAVLYQLEAHAKASVLGRPLRLQPDAADDGFGTYEQYSFYKDFVRPDLLMPWSVAFSFLADSVTAAEALRELLRKELHGPFGLIDSTDWPTGAVRPSRITARHDLWNVTLSTLGLVQYLYDANEDLAGLPEVAAALNQVFTPRNFPTLQMTIRAADFVGLRVRVDVVRARTGLQSIAWTDLSLEAGITLIRAAHLVELRQALDAAYTAIGRVHAPYTDSGITAGSSIVRAIHVTEPRRFVEELEAMLP